MTDLREALTAALRDVDWGIPERHLKARAETIIAALPPGTALITDAERAVVEAAIAWHKDDPDEDDLGNALDAAVDALMEAER